MTIELANQPTIVQLFNLWNHQLSKKRLGFTFKRTLKRGAGADRHRPGVQVAQSDSQTLAPVQEIPGENRGGWPSYHPPLSYTGQLINHCSNILTCEIICFRKNVRFYIQKNVEKGCRCRQAPAWRPSSAKWLSNFGPCPRNPRRKPRRMTKLPPTFTLNRPINLGTIVQVF